APADAGAAPPTAARRSADRRAPAARSRRDRGSFRRGGAAAASPSRRATPEALGTGHRDPSASSRRQLTANTRKQKKPPDRGVIGGRWSREGRRFWLDAVGCPLSRRRRRRR